MKSKVEVWPVIHVRDSIQVCENVAMAREAGCAGVMLIAMDGRNDNSDHAAMRLVGNPLHPGFKIGVNYLGVTPIEALRRAMANHYDALWLDEQLFSAGTITGEGLGFIQPERNIEVFAAVAFKGQPHDHAPGLSALVAASVGLIPTTSGPDTGMMATIEHVKGCQRTPPGPLAIASGITPLNVHQYLPFVTHILVNTGVSKDFHTFDPGRLAALMIAVKAGGK